MFNFPKVCWVRPHAASPKNHTICWKSADDAVAISMVSWTSAGKESRNTQFIHLPVVADSSRFAEDASWVDGPPLRAQTTSRWSDLKCVRGGVHTRAYSCQLVIGSLRTDVDFKVLNGADDWWVLSPCCVGLSDSGAGEGPQGLWF